MIPNPNEVSAFAVYSGLLTTSKSKQRRNRLKRQKENTKRVKTNEISPIISMKGNKVKKIDAKLSGKSKNKRLKASYNGLQIKKDSRQSKNIREKIQQDVIETSGSLEAIPDLLKCGNISSVEEGNASVQVSKKGKRKLDQSFEIPMPVSNADEIMDKNVLNDAQDLEMASYGCEVVKARKKGIPERMMRIRPNAAEKKKILKEEVQKKLKGKPSSSSIRKGKTVFESLISPYKADEFFSEYWEKKPLHIDRGGDSPIYSQYLSTEEMDTMLRYNMLMFGRNIDITSYTNGVRETHNPEGRAYPHVVWDYYSNGCSVRVLNPQTYLNKVHTLLAALQEYFGCFVGSNIYLTPANTQGFAPHYDDIEAFVFQIEGAKRWRVYNPRTPSEELPRYSSHNFNQDEIGSPILDIVLRPGDLLYFPRGFIHQAEALSDQHSLHITVSTYQKTTWFDLLEQALPVALANASENNIEFRKGLPIGYLRGAGLAYPTSSIRMEMISKLRKLFINLEKHFDIDDAVDKLGVTFIHQSLPPVLSKDEANCSVHNGGLKLSGGKLMNKGDITLNTKIRWIRANAFRIVEDAEEIGQVRLYHSVDNSKIFEGEDVQFVVLDKKHVPALIHLVKAYPAYTPVSKLPCSSDDEKLVLSGDLWDRGLLMSDCQLE